jgi:Domain of unknown function (DUF4340)
MLRRTLVLAGLVVLGVVLLRLVPAPERLTGLERVRGTRVVRIPRHRIRSLDVVLDGRHFLARRRRGGWTVGGRAVSGETAEALDDLAETLVGLRAVDAFRAHGDATYGLDAPRGTIEIRGRRRAVRLSLGEPNAAASAIYARRSGDPRTLQLGTYLLSAIDRVFYRLGLDRGQPPETG